MEVEQVSPDKLIPHEKNPKKHPKTQLKKLIKNIEEFGFTNPILAIKHKKKRVVIAGHARLEASKQMGLKKVPVVMLPISYEKALAYVIADNRIAEESEWDEEALRDLVDDIQNLEMPLELTGLDDDEIDDILFPNDEKGSAPSEIDQALQLKPPREYVLIMCEDEDAGQEQFEKLKELLGLKPVRRGGYKVGSPFDDIGTERVVKASDFIRIIEDAHSNSK
jgi:ParB-like chromosome segregation protein Spo0J